MPNRAGAAAKQVTTTPTEEWRSFKWIEPQLITYKARDGVDVYARLFTPEMIGARRDPARAGGGLRPRRRLRAERAQVLVELLPRVHVPQPARVARLRRARLDYRASSGYGRDWRTAIYRHMGGKDLEDVVDGAKYLVDDSRR